ncbi:hypothetical protein Dsin_028454 [Dipteronia sinensis]|uniref:50S ribosomal protein L16, chloroplastic n=1 Tax=Dipteronia sinensis TaxID=43782 RepID=A0AAD9ZQF4_9ROSI|nr:hypothetical protein Dsin_028454 [Dipteronia sinensis]
MEMEQTSNGGISGSNEGSKSTSIGDKPVTVRPTETRMGSGKGSPEYWVAVVKPGRILYEMGGVAENIARKAISIAASKMPIRTQFIISG